MAHNLSLLRKLRLGFNASMVFFGMLVLILTGAMIGKYPDDGYGNGSPGFGYILVFGVPAGAMMIWCAVDILLHFVGPRKGIPRKFALAILIIFCLGFLTSIGLSFAFRVPAGPEDFGYDLSRYADGDEFFWSSFALSSLDWLCHFSLCVVVSRQGSGLITGHVRVMKPAHCV